MDTVGVEVQEVIKAKRIELVGDDGAARVVIALDERGDPKIELSSKDNETRIRLGISGFSRKDLGGGQWPELVLENGTSRICLGGDLCPVEAASSSGYDELVPGSRLTLEDQSVRLNITTLPDERKGSGSMVQIELSNMRLMKKDPDFPGHREGRPTLRLVLRANGEWELTHFGEDEKAPVRTVHGQLGRALSLNITGETIDDAVTGGPPRDEGR